MRKSFAVFWVLKMPQNNCDGPSSLLTNLVMIAVEMREEPMAAWRLSQVPRESIDDKGNVAKGNDSMVSSLH